MPNRHSLCRRTCIERRFRQPIGIPASHGIEDARDSKASLRERTSAQPGCIPGVLWNLPRTKRTASQKYATNRCRYGNTVRQRFHSPYYRVNCPFRHTLTIRTDATTQFLINSCRVGSKDNPIPTLCQAKRHTNQQHGAVMNAVLKHPPWRFAASKPVVAFSSIVGLIAHKLADRCARIYNGNRPHDTDTLQEAGKLAILLDTGIHLLDRLPTFGAMLLLLVAARFLFIATTPFKTVKAS